MNSSRRLNVVRLFRIGLVGFLLMGSLLATATAGAQEATPTATDTAVETPTDLPPVDTPAPTEEPTAEPAASETPVPTTEAPAGTETPTVEPTPALPPSIQSDKADYAPGEIVTLTGANWQPGEVVHIFVNDDAGQTWNHSASVEAAADGTISYKFRLPDWFVATYSVRATGALSGVATTSFTDTAQYIDLDLAAAAPLTYDHTTGGGAWNNKTIGRGTDPSHDVVESLEGGDFICGNTVTFLTEIAVGTGGQVPNSSMTIEIDFSFTLDTTGQEGLALGPVTGVQVNYGAVSNGEGLGGTDSGMADDGNSVATLLSQTDPTVTEPDYFTAGEVNIATVEVTDVEKGEKIILRVDVQIACKFGSSPTGNLQAAIDAGRVMDPFTDTIPSGNQTVPFKAAGDVVFPGKIIVDKVTDPSPSTQSFDFSITSPGGPL